MSVNDIKIFLKIKNKGWLGREKFYKMRKNRLL